MDQIGKDKPTLNNAKLSEQVYVQIKHDILRKKIKLGGTFLEQELCERYGVSRTPVREAVQMLSADGIVEKRRHHLTRIIEMSKQDAKHLIRVRLELELVSVIENAPHFDDEDYAELVRLHGQCVAALDQSDLVGVFETDSLFHLELARRSRNPFLYEAYKKIDSKVQLLRSVEYSMKERILPVLTMHSNILDCLRGRNLESALDYMRRHVLASDEFVLSSSLPARSKQAARSGKAGDKKRIGEVISHHIKKMILNGQIGIGERIPEEKIAKFFNASRTPIREALRNLEKYGLVKIIPRRYAEVVRLKPDARERLGILKIHIDSLAVELCVDNASSADCDLLESMAMEILEWAEKKDLAATYEADSAFHLKLAELGDNASLYQIEQMLDVNVQLLRTIVYTNEEQIARGLQLHLPLVKAIRAKDKSAAVALIQKHLRDFYLSED